MSTRHAQVRTTSKALDSTESAGPAGERPIRSEVPKIAAATARPGLWRRRLHARECLWLVGRLFPPGLAIDAVTTLARFEAPPGEVWEKMIFYEEVPNRPPLLLRIFLPSPVKTQASGKRVGATVECDYSRGSLVKRFTVLAPPNLVHFDVIEQELGLERCVRTVEGSYEIRADGGGSQVALTTKYRGHLRPRWLWRGLERLLAHQLHRHILVGMGAKRVHLGKTASKAMA